MVRFPEKVKRKILELQDDRCADCHKNLTPKITHFDHILPKWDGGDDELENVQALCANCHSIKTHTENKKKTLKRKSENKKYEGPFTEMWAKGGGDEFSNSMERLFFEKEVLDYYSTGRFSGNFIIEKGITWYLCDKNRIWGLKFYNNLDGVSAHLVDLRQMPGTDQKRWHKHLKTFRKGFYL